MPLNEKNRGTEANGSISEDYCIYCYKDGELTWDMTMEQMIDFCAQFTDEIKQAVRTEHYSGASKGKIRSL